MASVSHSTMRRLLQAPLIIGTDLRNASAATLAILGNSGVIAINQDSLGISGRLVEERPPDPSALQVRRWPLMATDDPSAWQPPFLSASSCPLLAL